MARAANPDPRGEAPCRSVLAIGSAWDPYLALLRVGFAMRALLPKPRCALTAPFHPCPFQPARPSLSKDGGLLSVALSLRLPWAGVTRHPHFVEPGLSSAFQPAHPELVEGRGCPAPWRGVHSMQTRERYAYLVRPSSRSSSSWNRIARISPSTSPSILRGRQRRWNASTALAPSVMS